MPENAYRKRDLHDHYARGASPCPERGLLDQTPPAGMRPCQKLCIRCGRVTARFDDQGLPRCDGIHHGPVPASG